MSKCMHAIGRNLLLFPSQDIIAFINIHVRLIAVIIIHFCNYCHR